MIRHICKNALSAIMDFNYMDFPGCGPMNKKNIWQRSESDRKRVCSRKLTPLSTTNIQNSLFKDEKLWLATVRVSFWFFKVFRKKRRGDISLISCFNIIQLIRPNVLHRFVEIKLNKWYTLSVGIGWDPRRNCRVEITVHLTSVYISVRVPYHDDGWKGTVCNIHRIAWIVSS